MIVNINNFSFNQEPRDTILSRLSDGQWQTRSKILKHITDVIDITDDELKESLSSLEQDGVLLAGTNFSYRMVLPYLSDFREAKGMVSTYKNDLSAPRIFGGILEDDAWALAPLEARDFINFRSNDNVKEISVCIKKIDPDISVENDSGLVRIYTNKGDEVYSLIATTEKFSDKIKGLRIERNVRRRELKDLPQDFFYEFCEFYGKLAPTLLRAKTLSISSFIKDADDVKQQSYLWILDAVRRYDDSTSIPFAAYLHACLNKWVHDLARKEYGRAAADIELHTSKIRASFMKENLREPTVDEIAKEMQLNPSQMKDKLSHIGNVAAIRNAATVNNDEAPINIVSTENVEDNLESLAVKATLSLALMNTVISGGKHSDIVALNKIYKTTWASKITKSEVGKTVDTQFIKRFRTELSHLS